ncbi:MAG: hypothetical protein ACKVOL_06550, partial [Novosphingobium sp.]
MGGEGKFRSVLNVSYPQFFLEIAVPDTTTLRTHEKSPNLVNVRTLRTLAIGLITAGAMWLSACANGREFPE